ncbi:MULTISPECIES: hypothetical protein [unclassified Pseudofrankia]|uniref:hypothetical protein n=1 Tax=unclassified Pseudofrankia TaxID=2994372 RepID=UPI0009F51D5D|nr:MULTISPECIES: hypothetical protein [unclassified Pseudofrankia]MDT3446154.1 hypothetical protein [Pseudofrankia sp. BMG5.37]
MSVSRSPLPRDAHPPLSGFGEVHDLGTVVGVDGTALRLDRKAYVLCTPEPGDDTGTCLDGYRIDDVEAEIREYQLATTVRFTFSVGPEEYETGDLADLRERVASAPNHLMMLQLDTVGRVIAVGEPWLP